MRTTCARVAGVLCMLGALSVAGVTAAGGSASGGRVVGSPCRLVTRAEIASVLSGTTVGPGKRDARICRFEFATPESLAGQLALTTALFRGAAPSLVDGAVRIDEQLGLTTKPVEGLGRRAVYEVEKSNLIVLTKRGNIFEVQVLGGADPTPEILEQQAIELARLALARA